MTPIHFDPKQDLAPMPFDDRICRHARNLKNAGLQWRLHVGCFVWDPENYIKQDSPFPNRIYFVLSLPRFIEIFGDIEKMTEQLVWLPTWHQARLLCSQLGVPDSAVSRLWQEHEALPADEELFYLYSLVMDALIEKNFADLAGRARKSDKLSIAALIGRLGNLTAWPENFTTEVLKIYQQFIEAYLNILRQQKQKPLDWFPRYLSIDPELADGMRHFYSDYQHITKKFYKMNQELDRLKAIDKSSQSKLYQEKVDEIVQLCAE